MRPSLGDDCELGRLLRAGDPAGDGRDPDQAELQTWRRETLSATADDTGATWHLTRRLALPAFAAAAAMVLAVIFLLPPADLTPIAPSPQIAAKAPAPGIPDTAVPGPKEPPLLIAASPSPETATTLQPSRIPTVSTTPNAAIIPAAVSRTLQFTAPGGTRIIWTLNPDLQLDLHGGKS